MPGRTLNMRCYGRLQVQDKSAVSHLEDALLRKTPAVPGRVVLPRRPRVGGERMLPRRLRVESGRCGATEDSKSGTRVPRRTLKTRCYGSLPQCRAASCFLGGQGWVGRECFLGG